MFAISSSRDSVGVRGIPFISMLLFLLYCFNSISSFLVSDSSCFKSRQSLRVCRCSCFSVATSVLERSS
uniref:Uncharacterized protein n=1 Tax=Ixodes ricinus TaxID=34613 RepID=A0A147BJJ4_IXORI